MAAADKLGEGIMAAEFRLPRNVRSPPRTRIPDPEHQRQEEETAEQLTVGISGDSAGPGYWDCSTQRRALLLARHQPGQFMVWTPTAGKATLLHLGPVEGSAGCTQQ